MSVRSSKSPMAVGVTYDRYTARVARQLLTSKTFTAKVRRDPWSTDEHFLFFLVVLVPRSNESKNNNITHAVVLTSAQCTFVNLLIDKSSGLSKVSGLV